MIDLGTSLYSSTKTLSENTPRSAANNKGISASRDNDRKFSDSLKEKSSVPHVERDANSSREVQDDVARNYAKESRPRQPAQTVEEKKLATRQAAMDIFLDKMQSKLGVDPEEVLSAFSSLSLSEMTAPPEDSAGAVVSKLGLNENDSKAALELYNEMLTMTAAAGMAQYLNSNGQAADFNVLNQKEANLQELRHSIDDMSDRFFVTGSYTSPKAGVDQHAKIAKAYAAQMQVSPSDVGGEDKIDISMMTPTGGEEFSKLDINKNIMTVESPQTANTPNTVLETLKDISTESIENQQGYQLDQLDQLSPSELDAFSEELPLFKNNMQGAEISKLTSMSENAPAPISGLSAQSEFGADVSSDGDKDSDMGADGQPVASSTTEIHRNNIEKSFTINSPKASPADVQTNVKEIISQAQFLAKKGGGEMKVALNPDGMGEVSLKVKMINGQVNVEMVTSSNEAKKVLEKGLSELKDNLAAHKLHLDTIRIDSNKDISQHMDQQQKDMDQGFQQKFLSDFHDRNNGFRREMYEFGAPSVPKSQIRDTAANAQYDPSRKRKPDESRRLDLVA